MMVNKRAPRASRLFIVVTDRVVWVTMTLVNTVEQQIGAMLLQQCPLPV
jgi:hypothetical protein